MSIRVNAAKDRLRLAEEEVEGARKELLDALCDDSPIKVGSYVLHRGEAYRVAVATFKSSISKSLTFLGVRVLKRGGEGDSLWDLYGTLTPVSKDEAIAQAKGA